MAFHPATAPRPVADVRLLWLDRSSGRLHDGPLGALVDHLEPGDLLVLNDAATLPASLFAWAPDGSDLEIRLAGPIDDRGRAQAVLFGPGDWRTRTEDRTQPAPVGAGTRLSLEASPPSVVEIVAVSPLSPRLVTVALGGSIEQALEVLYARGRPVQYAYLDGELALWSVQTAYAARPWAVEAPSAGLGLTWSMLARLKDKGVGLATVTHASGLSSTGDPMIDAALPLAERSEVPRATIEAIGRARASNGRVIAVGTSVVRALEGRAALSSPLQEGTAVTDLRLGPDSVLRVVDGILTGMHAPGESHHQLLGAFAEPRVLARALTHAVERRYLAHELGDTMLIL